MESCQNIDTARSDLSDSVGAKLVDRLTQLMDESWREEKWAKIQEIMGRPLPGKAHEAWVRFCLANAPPKPAPKEDWY